MKLKTFLIGAAAAALLAVPGHAAELTLKFGHVGKPGSLFEASVDAFAACSTPTGPRYGAAVPPLWCLSSPYRPSIMRGYVSSRRFLID